MRRLAELERLFDAIRSAPVHKVDGLVENIRAHQRGPGNRALHHAAFADGDDNGKLFPQLSRSFLTLAVVKCRHGRETPTGSRFIE